MQVDDVRINLMHLRMVHRRLRDLCLPKCRLMISILADGPMNNTQLERAMYHRGSKAANQVTTSQTITMLKRARVIYRVYPPGKSLKLHYYALNQKEINKINNALRRFSEATHSSISVPGKVSDYV